MKTIGRGTPCGCPLPLVGALRGLFWRPNLDAIALGWGSAWVDIVNGMSGWDGWEVAGCACGTRCLKQDLRDFWGFQDGGVHGWSGWSGWAVALSSCGTRCLKQDLGDFWGFSGWGSAWVDIVNGMSGWDGWEVAGCACGARCLKQDLGDFWEIFRMGECTGGLDGQGGPWP